MNEIYVLQFKVRVNGEYKDVALTAVEVRLDAHNLIIFQYSSGLQLEYDMRYIKDLVIKQL